MLTTLTYMLCELIGKVCVYIRSQIQHAYFIELSSVVFTKEVNTGSAPQKKNSVQSREFYIFLLFCIRLTVYPYIISILRAQVRTDG